MRIVSHRKLKEFYETPGREDARVALEGWYQAVEDAQWTCFSDLREDFGSADSVVLPVPERPKKMAVFSPFISVFAEQCMEAMPFKGR